MKKITGLCVAVLLLVMAGCDGQETSSQAVSSGNMAAKKESLSLANDADIKSDLKSLNAIVNSYNSQAEKMRGELMQAQSKQDIAEGKKILKKTQVAVKETNTKLIALNLKSQEVQDVRVKIVDGNMKSVQLIELANKGSLSSEDKKQMALLGKQVVALQGSTGQQLERLNQKYPN